MGMLRGCVSMLRGCVERVCCRNVPDINVHWVHDSLGGLHFPPKRGILDDGLSHSVLTKHLALDVAWTRGDEGDDRVC